MAGARQVTIQFLGDARKFVSETGHAASATDKFTGKLRTVAKAALIGFAGATIAAGKVMFDMAQAAVDDEKSAALLANTLRKTTGATKAQIAANEDWISAMGKSLGVADDDLRPALAKLATATGSLKKAQQDASLAMDVAAGSGKSLQQVSQALARAISSDSASALSRYGVQTKDAAGKTRDLNAVLGDLSKKYAGAASSAANTTAGKFERLKLDISETEEAIGYKLLPVLDDLGSWLLKDGVPAIENLAHEFKQDLGPVLRDARTWISDNKGEMQNLGREVLNDVIPAIRTLGSDASTALGWFLKLPEPVKRFGVEAALAAAILPKLTGAMQALKLQEMITNLGNAETRMKGLGNAAKTAAGVAGMLALADGAQQANQGISDLEMVAGGAATGFAMGGPIGAGVGALAGAIGAVAKSTNSAKDAFHIAKPEAAGFADTLNDVSGAATSASQSTAALALQEAGAFDAARQLGLSNRDLVKYVLGNEGAIKKVNAAMVSGQKQMTMWTDQFGVVHTYLTGNSQAAQKLSGILHVNADAFEADRKKAQDLSLASGTLSRALKGVQDRSKIVADIQTKGYPETKRELADLIRTYNLTPKQIKTLIQATGVDASVSGVQNLIDHINSVHNKTVHVTTVVEAITPGGKSVPLPGAGRVSAPAPVGKSAIAASRGLPSSAERSAIASTEAATVVNIHFGVVGDPVAAAREVIAALRKYERATGRRVLVSGA